MTVSKTPPDLAAMEQAFAKVRQGGRGAPEGCVARYRVAIVVPFRDRFQHLMTLLYNLHPMLLRQQIDYQIFVVEQEGECVYFVVPTDGQQLGAYAKVEITKYEKEKRPSASNLRSVQRER
jgi:hypothetical protein